MNWDRSSLQKSPSVRTADFPVSESRVREPGGAEALASTGHGWSRVSFGLPWQELQRCRGRSSAGRCPWWFTNPTTNATDPSPWPRSSARTVSLGLGFGFGLWALGRAPGGSSGTFGVGFQPSTFGTQPCQDGTGLESVCARVKNVRLGRISYQKHH